MGLTLQFSTLGFFNFSHASIIMVGAYISWYFLVQIGVPYTIAFALMVVLTFSLGAAIQKIVIQPTVDKGGELVAIIIATLGVSTVLDNVILITFGGRMKRIPSPIEGGLQLGSGYVSYHGLLIVVCALGALGAIGYILQRTKVGMAMRAVAQDKEAAVYAGIPLKRIYLYVLGLGSALGGVAGAFLGSVYFMTPSMGLEPLTKAFIVCVLGGLTSVRGTVVSAYTIAVLESLVALVLGIYWTSPLLFLFMIVVLIVRPYGILGSKS